MSKVTVADFITYVCEAGSAKDANHLCSQPSFVTYLNAACSNIAADDEGYHNILARSNCVYADGQAVVWAAKVLGYELPERVNAGDFIIDFCRYAADAQLTLGLLGGRPGVARKAADAWRREVPGLRIAGAWDGFFSEGDDEIVRLINEARPDILLVGMGVPLQEKWAWNVRHSIDTKVIWCVGALFEYYGQGRPRAPVLLRRIGLEWLFRLCLEPRRLWRRYLIGNLRFLWRLLRARVKAGPTTN